MHAFKILLLQPLRSLGSVCWTCTAATSVAQKAVHFKQTALGTLKDEAGLWAVSVQTVPEGSLCIVI